MSDDWFLPAVMAEGGLGSCLDYVIRQEEARAFFVKSLKDTLCSWRGSSSDAIHHLRQQVGVVRNTCQHRLGVLSGSPFKAWFRMSLATELGPFPGTIIQKPILVEFPRHLAIKLRNEILGAWEERSSVVLSLPPGECLWRTLLELNQRWLQTCRLPEPYHDLRLDELPEGLPDDLSCQSLTAFLQQVRKAVDAARSELDACFVVLFQGTEAFLKTYYQRLRYQDHDAPKFRRRQGGVGESLAYMSFTATPSAKELKRRYLEMAKVCHPDVTGGEDLTFKNLTFHYQNILKQIPKL